MKKYIHGETIIFKPENKKYDFGYYSQTPGMCVLYEVGELNMQDSIAVDLKDIRKEKEG